MRSFFASVVWSALSQLVAAGSLLLVGVVTARLLGPEGRGLYATFFFTAGLAATVLRLGIHEGIVYLQNRQGVDPGILLGNSVVYLAVCAVCSSALAGGVWLWWGQGAFFGLDGFGAALLVVTSLLIMVGETLGGFVMAQHRYDQYSLNLVIQNGAILLATVALLALEAPDLDDALVWRVAATAAGLPIPLLFAASIARSYAIRVSLETLWTQLSFGLKSTVQLVLALLNFRVYLYALIFFVGATAAGEFSVALLFVEVVRFAPNALGLVLFPALTRVNEFNELDTFMARASRNLMFVTVVTVLIGIVLVPVITITVFGPEYASIATGTRIMLVAAAFGVTYQILSRYFTSRHLQSYNIWITCVGLLVAAVCSVILTPRLGFEGAAWAFFAGQGTSGILMVSAFLRLSGLPAAEVLVVNGSDLVHMRDSVRRFMNRVA